MNVWKQFFRLQPAEGLKLATVVSVGDAESILEDYAGQQFRALGTDAAVGAKVFVKGGVIQSGAPGLSDVGVLYV